MNNSWPDKYIIGLTGNIATGKSVVRKMLEHLGAYGIDADVLAHRAIARGSPGYTPVLQTFGKWILDDEQQINRKRLGDLVFSNPEALSKLETIVHPLVHQAVRMLIDHAGQKVIVIEAIKLLESELVALCDQIWVTRAAREKQIERLMYKRKLSYEEALHRMDIQGSLESKLQSADVVIDNSETFEKTWDQVNQAWNTIPIGQKDVFPEQEFVISETPRMFSLQRATPKQTDEIAAFMTQYDPELPTLSREDIMRAFGEKAYLLLRSSDQIVGILGWQVENLITRVSEVMIKAGVPVSDSLQMLIDNMEKASEELQSEISLIFLEPNLARHKHIWEDLGYQRIDVDDLTVRSWRNAALETITPDTVMYYKRLREQRILRPM